METGYYQLSARTPDERIIMEAGAVLRRGGLVAFPTETVYGLGGNGYLTESVKAIYQAKGRPSDNPLILHIAEMAMLDDLAKSVPESAKRAVEAFWPGPLTIIVPKSDKVPLTVTGGLDTVAVRFPSSLIAQRLIQAAGVPIAAPSANLSGRPSPTSASAVMEDLNGRIDMILDGGTCPIGVESTVLDCSVDVPVILRPGGITYEMLTEVLPQVKLDPGFTVGAAVAPKAPGMKYRHYAPQAPVLLFEGEPDRVRPAMAERLTQELAKGRKVGLLICDEWCSLFSGATATAAFGPLKAPQEAALRVFAALRFFDHQPVDIILAQGIADAGIGRAVMNRLRKAAGQQIVRL